VKKRQLILILTRWGHLVQENENIIFLVGTHILPYDLKTAFWYGKSFFNKILGHTTLENYMVHYK